MLSSPSRNVNNPRQQVRSSARRTSPLTIMVKLMTDMTLHNFSGAIMGSVEHLIHDVNPSQLGEAQWCISPISWLREYARRGPVCSASRYKWNICTTDIFPEISTMQKVSHLIIAASVYKYSFFFSFHINLPIQDARRVGLVDGQYFTSITCPAQTNSPYKIKASW